MQVDSIREDGSISLYFSASVIELSTTLGKRNKIVWKHKGKIIAEGTEYIPNVNDIGKIFNDRLRGTVVTECQLPPVKSGPPRVTNVTLSIEEIPGTLKHKVSAFGDFSGGIEGKSIIIWKVQKPGETEEIEVERTTQK